MPSPVSFKGLTRRFRRNRRGSAAVEFALVAPLFIALLFAVIETALMFFASQVLETVTQESARMIFTGQAQQGNWTQAQFNDYVCKQIPGLFSCNNISIDVQRYTSFGAIALGNQISGGTFVPPNNFNCGGPGDIVVVRLFYPWQLFVTGLGYNIANLSGDKRLLVATAAFQNEPYTGGACQ